MSYLIALGLMCFPALALALNWETPLVNSHQGEPLEVRIEVTDLAAVTPTQIFPLLASEVAFTERGIERPDSLSSLTYAIDSSNGAVELVIRTATAWMKPELTTLIEVFTPDGSVLIPVSLEIGENPEKVDQPAVTEILQNLVVEVPLQGSLSNAESKPSGESQAQKQVTLIVPNGSTLWRLASRVQPEDATIEQVIMALYDENPDVFEFSNINALEKGKILLVPSARRIRQDAPLEAKRRFDAHMNAPKAIFPRNLKGEPEPPVVNLNSEVVPLGAIPAVVASEDQALNKLMPKEETEAQLEKHSSDAIILTEAPVIKLETANVVLSEDTLLLDKISVLEMKLDKMGAKITANADMQIAETNSLLEAPPMKSEVLALMSPAVTELLDKISVLETKLDQMGAKLDNMVKAPEVIKQKPGLVFPVLPSAESTVTMQLKDWVPSQLDVETFLATRFDQVVNWIPFQVDVETSFREALGQIGGWIPFQVDMELFLTTQLGTLVLILFILLIFIWLLLRSGQKIQDPKKSTQLASSLDPSTEEQDSIIGEPMVLIHENNREADEALESAVERLKAKIDDPTKQQETEELYSGGNESLIEAFSADALNENPEWGEDPDDEADVAAHQLELAQNYLAMGMTQTAIELLVRVAVSPDRESAAKANALLDVHRS